MLQGIRAILDSSADSGIVVRFPGLSFAVTRGGQTRFYVIRTRFSATGNPRTFPTRIQEN